MENYFLRVAKTFENHVDGDPWHRDLVRRMSIEVEGIRPTLRNDETGIAVDELRAFLHVFRKRSLNCKRLSPERWRHSNPAARSLSTSFDECRQKLGAQIRRIICRPCYTSLQPTRIRAEITAERRAASSATERPPNPAGRIRRARQKPRVARRQRLARRGGRLIEGRLGRGHEAER